MESAKIKTTKFKLGLSATILFLFQQWDASIEQELVLLMEGCPSTLGGASDAGTIFKLVPISSAADLTAAVFENLTSYISEWFSLGEYYNADSDTCDEQQRCGLYKQVTSWVTSKVSRCRVALIYLMVNMQSH